MTEDGADTYSPLNHTDKRRHAMFAEIDCALNSMAGAGLGRMTRSLQYRLRIPAVTERDGGVKARTRGAEHAGADDAAWIGDCDHPGAGDGAGRAALRRLGPLPHHLRGRGDAAGRHAGARRRPHRRAPAADAVAARSAASRSARAGDEPQAARPLARRRVRARPADARRVARRAAAPRRARGHARPRRRRPHRGAAGRRSASIPTQLSIEQVVDRGRPRRARATPRAARARRSTSSGSTATCARSSARSRARARSSRRASSTAIASPAAGAATTAACGCTSSLDPADRPLTIETEGTAGARARRAALRGHAGRSRVRPASRCASGTTVTSEPWRARAQGQGDAARARCSSRSTSSTARRSAPSSSPAPPSSSSAPSRSSTAVLSARQIDLDRALRAARGAEAHAGRAVAQHDRHARRSSRRPPVPVKIGIGIDTRRRSAARR